MQVEEKKQFSPTQQTAIIMREELIALLLVVGRAIFICTDTLD